jgi:hypothetical protein
MYGRGGTAAPVAASQPASGTIIIMDGWYVYPQEKDHHHDWNIAITLWSNFFFFATQEFHRSNESEQRKSICDTHPFKICGSIMEKQKHDDTNVQHFETQYRDCCVRRWDKSWKQRQLPLRYLLIDRNDTQQKIMRFDWIIDWSG